MKFLNSIDGASKIITDSNNQFITSAQKAELHTHTNSAVLNNITEVDGELRYNGETVVTKTVFTWARLKGQMSWGELIGL